MITLAILNYNGRAFLEAMLPTVAAQTAGGFRIHVIDDRERFASAERFPGSDIVVAPIPEWLQSADLPATAYVVILTRGHQHDLEAMRALVPRELKYLGLIGSRAKVARIRTALLSEGLPAGDLDRVHAPIGLDIGAVTPAEIAVSILAELIAVRRGVETSQMSMSVRERPTGAGV